MASLTGQPVNSTYEALIKFGDNQPVAATLKVLSDGDGTNLPIQVSTTEVSFTGNLNLTTATITGLSSSDLSDASSLATVVYVDAADTTLQTNIDNEESARITADTQLQSNIDAEASARSSADTALQGQITTNASAITDLQNGVGNVTSFNTLDGDVTISAGTNITFNTVGQDIQINASGTGGSAVDDVNGLVGAIDVVSTDLDLLTVSVDAVNNEIELNPILPRTMLEDVKNVSGGALTKGMALHITGSVGNEAEVIAADAASGLAAHLILNEDLPNNGDSGKAVAVGFINNVSVPDTTNFQAGTEVYLGNAGAFTHIKPTGTSIVQYLGVVLNASTTSGAGTISGIIQNLGVENQLPNLTQDYVWVGDSNGVPQEVAVSTLGGTTINNNADNRVITGSNTANTLEGESKLTFDGNNLKIISSNNDTAYLQISGGAFGAVNPTVSTNNFGVISVDTNIYMTGQNKIGFDSDLLNTYIAADTADPESLEIHADAKVKIWADEGFEVWEPIATPSKMFSVLPDATGTQARVTIGGDANTDYHFQNFGITRINKLHYDDAYLSPSRVEGQVIYVGAGTTNVGRIHVLQSGGWVLANSTNCTGLLAVALGSSATTNGMVVMGTAATTGGTFTLGSELYLNSSGALTATPPSTSGEIARKIGYSLGGITYTFTPSMDYFTIE